MLFAINALLQALTGLFNASTIAADSLEKMRFYAITGDIILYTPNRLNWFNDALKV